jgi:hypothetical protein
MAVAIHLRTWWNCSSPKQLPADTSYDQSLKLVLFVQGITGRARTVRRQAMLRKLKRRKRVGVLFESLLSLTSWLYRRIRKDKIRKDKHIRKHNIRKDKQSGYRDEVHRG